MVSRDLLAIQAEKVEVLVAALVEVTARESRLRADFGALRLFADRVDALAAGYRQRIGSGIDLESGRLVDVLEFALSDLCTATGAQRTPLGAAQVGPLIEGALSSTREAFTAKGGK